MFDLPAPKNKLRATIEESTAQSPARRRTLRRLAPAGRTHVRRSRGERSMPALLEAVTGEQLQPWQRQVLERLTAS